MPGLAEIEAGQCYTTCMTHAATPAKSPSSLVDMDRLLERVRTVLFEGRRGQRDEISSPDILATLVDLLHENGVAAQFWCCQSTVFGSNGRDIEQQDWTHAIEHAGKFFDYSGQASKARIEKDSRQGITMKGANLAWLADPDGRVGLEDSIPKHLRVLMEKCVREEKTLHASDTLDTGTAKASAARAGRRL